MATPQSKPPTCTSDDEADSPDEDSHIEQDLLSWLATLDQKAPGGGNQSQSRQGTKLQSITTELAMQSFRNSFMLTNENESDIDALLNELCQLEATIDSQQNELDTRLKPNQAASAKSGGSLPGNQSFTELPPPPSLGGSSVPFTQSPKQPATQPTKQPTKQATTQPTKQPTKHSPRPPPPPVPRNAAHPNTKPSKQLGKLTGTQSVDQQTYDWDDDVDSQLQVALDCLTDLSTFDHEDEEFPRPPPLDGSSHMDTGQKSLAASAKNITSGPSMAGKPGTMDMSGNTMGEQQHIQGSHCGVAGNVHSSSAKNQRSAAYDSGRSQTTDDTLHLPQQYKHANMTTNTDRPRPHSGGYQGYSGAAPHHDLSPNSFDMDSAFSDSASLPLSGSHVSVATTGSGGSAGNGSQGTGSSSSSGLGSGDSNGGRATMGVGASGSSVKTTVMAPLTMDTSYSGGPPGPSSPSHHAVFSRLRNLQDEMQREQLSPEQQQERLKQEKIKIALEKIKQAEIKKLFVQAHMADGSSKSLLVDERMRVCDVIDRLVAKNHVTHNINWAVVEHLPQLNMERMLEDHENLVEVMLSWETVSKNTIHFLERLDKYHCFLRPEEYFIKEKREGEVYDQSKRDALINEFLSTDRRTCPDIEGVLYIKTEGRKNWNKQYCLMRMSGIYCNPKGKSKSAKDLVCIQKFDNVDIYTAVGWRKKFKAPNEFGFALKHPRIQKKNAKYIRYFCAEDCRSMAQWVTAIRIAKHGVKLRENYTQMQQNVATFVQRDIVPNPNFKQYVENHEKVMQHYSERGSKIHQSEASTQSTNQNPSCPLSPTSSTRRSSKDNSSKDNSNNRQVALGKKDLSSQGNYSKSSPNKSNTQGSVRSKRDINVVILDRRKSSPADEDSNPNIVVLTKRMSNASSASDTKSLESMGSVGDRQMFADGSVESQLDCMHSSDSSSLQSAGKSSRDDRISPVKSSEHPISSQQTPQKESDFGGAMDDYKTTSIKRLPSLPVTTQVTKYLTEQTGVAGELNQRTLKRLKKKSSIDEGLYHSAQGSDLPPPPLDMLDGVQEKEEVNNSPLPSPALPPPPSMDELDQYSGTVSDNQRLKSPADSEIYAQIGGANSPIGGGNGTIKSNYVQPQKAPPKTHPKARLPLEELFDASGYMTVKASNKLAAHEAAAGLSSGDYESSSSNPSRCDNECYYVQLPDEQEATAEVFTNQTGTIKRAPPPPPPKRKPNAAPVGGETSHVATPREGFYAVTAVGGAERSQESAMVATPKSKLVGGYDTPKSPKPVPLSKASPEAIYQEVPCSNPTGTMKRAPATLKKNYPREFYAHNIHEFVSDLSRVVQSKHTRLDKDRTRHNQDSAPLVAPEPPPPRDPGIESTFVPEGLPPPPAELLEELKVLRQHQPRTAPWMQQRVQQVQHGVQYVVQQEQHRRQEMPHGVQHGMHPMQHVSQGQHGMKSAQYGGQHSSKYPHQQLVQELVQHQTVQGNSPAQHTQHSQIEHSHSQRLKVPPPPPKRGS